MTKLGVNIDHIATLRQTRRESFPDPVMLALEAVRGGAQGITAHLREDRRHIQDHDIFRLKKNIPVPLNLEMAASNDILRVALLVKPRWACLVPEKRQELTTEGGLNLAKNFSQIKKTIHRLHTARIRVSLFIDPTIESVDLSKKLGADAVELHTGTYARLWAQSKAKKELMKIEAAAHRAKALGLIANAGHGIDYQNVKDLCESTPFNEFNIGFAIVARAVSVGMKQAVHEMKEKIRHPE